LVGTSASDYLKGYYATREYAYGPSGELPDTQVGNFPVALMAEAKQSGWTVISMKNDWKRIFAFDQSALRIHTEVILRKYSKSRKPVKPVDRRDVPDPDKQQLKIQSINALHASPKGNERREIYSFSQ
jgi:hypothetical protein